MGVLRAIVAAILAIGPIVGPLPAPAAAPSLFGVLTGTFACTGGGLSESLTFRSDRNGIGALGEVRAADGTTWAEDLLFVDPPDGADEDPWMRWQVAPAPGAPNWEPFFGRSTSRSGDRKYYGTARGAVEIAVTSVDEFRIVRPAAAGGSALICRRAASVPCLVPELRPATIVAAPVVSVPGHAGLVSLIVDVDAQSNIHSVEIFRSADPELNESAKSTVEHSVFRTRRAKCAFVADRYLFRVEYRGRR